MIKNFLILMILATGQISYGQGGKMEKIKAERIAFMTEELELTSEEAQVFWPVYNKYSDEDFALKKTKRNLKKELRNSIIEEKDDVGSLFDQVLKKETEEIELKKKYIREFKKVLPENKAYKVFLAEEKFKHYLLKKLKERRG